MAVQLQYNVTAYLGNKYLVDKMFQNEPEIAIITKAQFIFFRGLVIIEDSCQKESNLTLSQLMPRAQEPTKPF